LLHGNDCLPGFLRAPVHLRIPLFTDVGCQQLRVCLVEKLGDAEIFRVVRDHQEIQWPDQFYPLAGVGLDHFTPGKPEAYVRAVCVPDQAAVH
jgi:hypothetical protein